MNRLRFAVVLIGAGVLHGALTPGGPCETGTVAEYEALGAGGCTIAGGFFTVSNFLIASENSDLSDLSMLTLVADLDGFSLRTPDLSAFQMPDTGIPPYATQIRFEFDIALQAPRGVVGNVAYKIVDESVGNIEIYYGEDGSTSGPNAFLDGSVITSGRYILDARIASVGPSANDVRYNVFVDLQAPEEVPEPSTWAMLGLGLCALGYKHFRDAARRHHRVRRT